MRIRKIALAAALFALAAAPATAEAAVLDFEDQPPLTEIDDEYAGLGITFERPDDMVRLPFTQESSEASSGQQVLVLRNCAGEFCRSGLFGRFSTLRSTVSMRVGELDDDVNGEVELVAFDVNGDVLATDGPRMVAGLAGVEEPFEVSVGRHEIGSFQLRVNAGKSRLAVDDLTFDDPPADADPDFGIAVTAPEGGGIRQGFEATARIDLNRFGSSGPIDLAVSGLPRGVHGRFSPDPAEREGSTLTLTADPGAPAVDAVVVTVTATPAAPEAGRSSRRDTFELSVLPNYALLPGPVLDVSPCATVAGAVQLHVPRHGLGTPEPGLVPAPFDGPVALSLDEAAPAGVSAEVAPASVDPRGTANVIVRALPGSLPTDRRLRIRAQAAGLPAAFTEVTLHPVPGPAGCELPAAQDLDEDGLTNAEEETTLKPFGADPRHKDVFLEIDHMEGHPIEQAAIDLVVASFARAPVTNPDGTPGIRLHVDNGPKSTMNVLTRAPWGRLSRANEVAHVGVLGEIRQAGYDWAQFNAIRAAHQDASRRGAFRYGLSAHQWGAATEFASGLGGGDRFLFTLGRNNKKGVDVNVGSLTARAGTVMHELGHTLNLGHGDALGDKHLNPTFLSVMNYRYQFSGLLTSTSCPGDTPCTSVLDYSRFGNDLAAPGGGVGVLDERFLDESHGVSATGAALRYVMTRVCPGKTPKEDRVEKVIPGERGVDWNCDGRRNDPGVRHDINRDGQFSRLQSDDEWARVRYATGATRGGAGAEPDVVPPVDTIDADELQRMAAQNLGDLRPPRLTQRVVRGRRGRVLVVTARDRKGVDSLQLRVGRRTLRVTPPHSRRRITTRVRIGRGRLRGAAVAFDSAGNERSIRLRAR